MEKSGASNDGWKDFQKAESPVSFQLVRVAWIW